MVDVINFAGASPASEMMASNDHAARRARPEPYLRQVRSAAGQCRSKIKIGDHKIFDELQCAFHDRPVLASDHGVTVEDQFILTTDEVEIGAKGQPASWARRLTRSPRTSSCPARTGWR